jgi:hypothetical protein
MPGYYLPHFFLFLELISRSMLCLSPAPGTPRPYLKHPTFPRAYLQGDRELQPHLPEGLPPPKWHEAPVTCQPDPQLSPGTATWHRRPGTVQDHVNMSQLFLEHASHAEDRSAFVPCYRNRAWQVQNS